MGNSFNSSHNNTLLLRGPKMKDYWEKNKGGLLPKIKDWTSPHNEIRHSNNVKAMTYNEWLYIHPSAYKLIWYGTDWVGIVIFGLVAWFLAHKGSFFGASIPLVFVIALIYDLIRKIIKRDEIKDLTLYDRFMREF